MINVINDSETDDVDSSLEALMNGLALSLGSRALIDKPETRRWRQWIFQFAPLDGHPKPANMFDEILR